MDVVLLLARLVLAGVFVASGLSKLADRAGSRQAVADFGLPTRLVGPIAALLPVAELAVAVALIPRASAWWGALGGLALLLGFIAGIGYNLARGRTPDCHCFGQLHSEPIGASTLIRNGVLALLALLVLAGGPSNPGRSAVAWLDDLSSGTTLWLVLGLVALALLAVEGWLLVHLLGQNGRLLVRLDALEEALAGRGSALPAAAAAPAQPEPGLPIGAPAPAFSLSGLHGETMTLDALRAAGKPMVLLFTDPTCGPCNALLPDVGAWQRDHGTALTVALLSRGGAAANRGKTAEHGLANVLLQENREVAEAYEANATPAAVLVRPDATVGSAVALGADAIRALVARAVGAPAPVPVPAPVAPTNGAARPAAAPGGPAPALELPNLAGETVRLIDFRGDPTLVLFWNPGCGFCARMLDDLKAWETGPGAAPGAPKLLVVSTGTAEANAAMDLRSVVVLDEGFTAGRSFGASGTPSALLVDAAGNLASAVAVGAPGVLALARGENPAAANGSANGNGAPVAPAVKIGDAAPTLRLPDLGGEPVALGTLLRGTRTLVVFWDPACGFCSRTLDDLKAWEANPPKGAPKLLVISKGSAETNRVMGLRAPILLDEGFAAGRAFGTDGTPSAVLVNGRGRVASEVAVGAEAVFALAGGQGDRIELRAGPA